MIKAPGTKLNNPKKTGSSSSNWDSIAAKMEKVKMSRQESSDDIWGGGGDANGSTANTNALSRSASRDAVNDVSGNSANESEGGKKGKKKQKGTLLFQTNRPDYSKKF